MCDACARVHLVHSLLLLDARQLLLSLMHLVLQLLILLLVLLRFCTLNEFFNCENIRRKIIRRFRRAVESI